MPFLTFNLENLRTPSGTPSSWKWVTLCGPDAKDFLHRLTTVNLKRIQPGQGASGCFLTPQGKIRSWFTLWRFGTDDFAFEYEAGIDQFWTTQLLAAIDQYTFAEKQTLKDVTELDCRWFFCEPQLEAQLLEKLGAAGLKAGETVANGEEIRLCHRGLADYGKIMISAWGRPARLQQFTERAFPNDALKTLALEDLEKARIQSLRPRLGAEITLETQPLEVGLFDAVAESKGCYPGQEVIEKVISLGSPAKRLILLEGTGPSPSRGDKLFTTATPPAEAGEITSIAQISKSTDRFLALAVVRKIHAKEGVCFNTESGINLTLLRATASSMDQLVGTP